MTGARSRSVKILTSNVLGPHATPLQPPSPPPPPLPSPRSEDELWGNLRSPRRFPPPWSGVAVGDGICRPSPRLPLHPRPWGDQRVGSRRNGEVGWDEGTREGRQQDGGSHEQNPPRALHHRGSSGEENESLLGLLFSGVATSESRPHPSPQSPDGRCRARDHAGLVRQSARIP